MLCPLVAQQSPLSVKNIEEIKVLQDKLLEVVQHTQPATVSLTSDATGAWGSGVVVSKDGLVLSAAHVVDGASAMTVIFPDGKETNAQVLGYNKTKDIAMLKIMEQGEYPFVELGSSDQLVAGSFLVAMGHAGGHDALRKPPVRFGRMLSRNLSGFFSSDCTLIGGDSGGPVFDVHGRLVGINSSIGVDIKANNHAGISGLKEDWQRLEKGDQWGSLGASPLADKDGPILGVLLAGSRSGGVVVGPVSRNSPAQRAGLLRGDIVLAIQGTRVRSVEQVFVEVNRYRPGQNVELVIWRENRQMTKEVTLMRRGDLTK